MGLLAKVRVCAFRVTGWLCLLTRKEKKTWRHGRNYGMKRRTFVKLMK